MTGKDKAAKKNPSMFGKDGFCAFLILIAGGERRYDYDIVNIG